MSFCVGLTGGLATGKSAAAAIFAQLGATLIDADVIGRALTAPGGVALLPLRTALGDWAFTPGGELRRAEVRTRVFADAEMRRTLEDTLHPLIATEMQNQIMVAAPRWYILLVIPLLFETKTFVSWCRHIILMDCAPQTQIARACARDDMSAAAAQEIMDAQMSRAEKKALAADIINNDGDWAALENAVRARHDYVLELMRKERGDG